MGENIYTVASGRIHWEDCQIQFSAMDDDTACLCTFPHNFKGVGIDREHVRSLALLGAAVVLAHQGELENDSNVIPYCIPEWIRDDIDKALK